MKVNENQLYSLYSPQKVHATPARASKPDNVQKSERAQKFSLKETAHAADARQKEIEEFRKVLSSDERKMFDLLFPADNAVKNSVPVRKFPVRNNYQDAQVPVNRKILGSRLDIRG